MSLPLNMNGNKRCTQNVRLLHHSRVGNVKNCLVKSTYTAVQACPQRAIWYPFAIFLAPSVSLFEWIITKHVEYFPGAQLP